jgi:dTMP kinase
VRNGRLISFEGIDGSGKTTQIDMLEPWLKLYHISYLRTREPGGTPLGEEIENILLYRPELLPITPLAEAFLFQADRAQHFAEVVLPALEEGLLVVTDRCFDASIAYQGYARGVSVKLVEELSLLAMQGRVPDLTILLDLNPSQVHERVGYRGGQLPLPILSALTHDQKDVRDGQNRLDTETEGFHRRVQNGFRALARAHPERIKVVDASRTPEEIHQQIIGLVQALL